MSNVKIDGNQLFYEMRFGNFEGSAVFEGVLEEGVLTGTVSFQGQVRSLQYNNPDALTQDETISIFVERPAGSLGCVI